MGFIDENSRKSSENHDSRSSPRAHVADQHVQGEAVHVNHALRVLRQKTAENPAKTTISGSSPRSHNDSDAKVVRRGVVHGSTHVTEQHSEGEAVHVNHALRHNNIRGACGVKIGFID
jgi:hypothetical protein